MEPEIVSSTGNGRSGGSIYSPQKLFLDQPFLSSPLTYILDYDPAAAQQSTDGDSQGDDGLILWMCTPHPLGSAAHWYLDYRGIL